VSIHANIRICQEDDTQLTGAAWGLVSHILMYVLSYFPLRMKLSQISAQFWKYLIRNSPLPADFTGKWSASHRDSESRSILFSGQVDTSLDPTESWSGRIMTEGKLRCWFLTWQSCWVIEANANSYSLCIPAAQFPKFLIRPLWSQECISLKTV
jgi:hypothetical protein